METCVVTVVEDLDPDGVQHMVLPENIVSFSDCIRLLQVWESILKEVLIEELQWCPTMVLVDLQCELCEQTHQSYFTTSNLLAT